MSAVVSIASGGSNSIKKLAANFMTGGLSSGADVIGSLNPKLPGYQPPTPTVIPPPVMPIPDEQAVKMAQAAAIARQRRRKGRQSTILTATGDVGSATLGAG